MSLQKEFNSALPEQHLIVPPKEGGNGVIHHPGQYENLIWQSRSRVPEPWESTLIDHLEQLFADGALTLDELVSGLNARKFYDKEGVPWNTASFSAFLEINGY